ncbi:MAG TPA: hypothetical protein VKS79_24260 [Gemmataceae bacterium]|nr:hypothetical protein [Gemmataceae bacterium]
MEVRTFNGKDGNTYIVYGKEQDCSYRYHVFVEVEAKEAARDCGAEDDGKINTISMWDKLWKE